MAREYSCANSLSKCLREACSHITPSPQLPANIQFPQQVKNWVQSNAGWTSASVRGFDATSQLSHCERPESCPNAKSNTPSLPQDGRQPAGVKLGVTASWRGSAVPLCDLTDQREADSWGFLYTSLKSHPLVLFISFHCLLHFLFPRHPRPASTDADPPFPPLVYLPSAPSTPASPISICLIQRPGLRLAAV